MALRKLILRSLMLTELTLGGIHGSLPRRAAGARGHVVTNSPSVDRQCGLQSAHTVPVLGA